jgi:hypothetical protein
MGKWRYIYIILDRCINWRWVVNFTPRALYFREKNP